MQRETSIFTYCVLQAPYLLDTCQCIANLRELAAITVYVRHLFTSTYVLRMFLSI